jgi:A/G-specific adenine glycosylase
MTASLLHWYTAHARVMPWRVGPAERRAGERPDPYRVWLSEIMLQQTTVAAVRDYFRRFTVRWPDVAALAGADDAAVMAEWAGLGYYARARNLLRTARAVRDDHGGRFPESRDALLTLPGIGPYTAAAIAAIAFDERATVIDGNVERVVTRLFAIATPLPKARALIAERAAALTPADCPGDHAQAMMDLGATICTPRSPACAICPVAAFCAARATADPAAFPVKAPKTARPTRRGIAYVARRADGAWLVETRAPKGLLGGMLGWPGTDWMTAAPDPDPPVAADWRDAGPEVRHTFTHFDLILTVMVAALPADLRDDRPVRRGAFVPAAGFDPASLPTVMRKVHDVARAALAGA